MLLDKFLHDQKIVRASMLLSKHYQRKYDAEDDVAMFRMEHACAKSQKLRCWNRFTNRKEWCHNCDVTFPEIDKLKAFKVAEDGAKRVLVKLCQVRENKWPSKRK